MSCTWTVFTYAFTESSQVPRVPNTGANYCDTTLKAAENLDETISTLVKNFGEGSDYFKVLHVVLLLFIAACLVYFLFWINIHPPWKCIHAAELALCVLMLYAHNKCCCCPRYSDTNVVAYYICMCLSVGAGERIPVCVADCRARPPQELLYDR